MWSDFSTIADSLRWWAEARALRTPPNPAPEIEMSPEQKKIEKARVKAFRQRWAKRLERWGLTPREVVAIRRMCAEARAKQVLEQSNPRNAQPKGADNSCRDLYSERVKLASAILEGKKLLHDDTRRSRQLTGIYRTCSTA